MSPRQVLCSGEIMNAKPGPLRLHFVLQSLSPGFIPKRRKETSAQVHSFPSPKQASNKPSLSWPGEREFSKAWARM